ncbi:hypothetical protein KQH50_03100 [bacterium]|nr:hypothetical protein [bacterium]
MEKRSRIWLFVILFVVIIGAVGLLFVLKVWPFNSSAPDPAKTRLELSFDSPDDLDWITFAPEDEAADIENVIQDGVLHLAGGGSIFAVNNRYELESGYLIHYRLRTSEDGPCFGTGLEFAPNGEQTKSIGVDGCGNNALNVGAAFNKDNDGDTIGSSLPLRGTVPLLADQWVDIVFWISDAGDEIRYVFGHTSGQQQVAYGGVTLPEDWQSERWRNGLVIYFDTAEGEIEQVYVDVDSIKVASGSLSSYLYYDFPAYESYQDEIDAFLAQPAADFPELTAGDEQSETSLEEDGANEADDEAVADVTEAAPTNTADTGDDFWPAVGGFSDLMLQYEDLPEEFNFYQLETKFTNVGNFEILSKTFRQGETRSGGGLWVVNALTISENEFTEEIVKQLLDFTRYDSMNEDAPAVGPVAFSFRRQPFDRYLFTKGNMMVDLYCNSAYTGYHDYCSPENLAGLAQLIYDRLPEEATALSPITFDDSDSSSEISDLQIVVKEGREQMVEVFREEPLGVGVSAQEAIEARWFVQDWLSSLRLGVYWQQGERYVYAWEADSLEGLGVGEHSAGITLAEAGDPLRLPEGDYIVRIFADEALADEIEFALYPED